MKKSCPLNYDISNEQHNSRIKIRQNLRTERYGLSCKNCRKRIPETRKITAKFCTEICRRNFYTAKKDKIRREIRTANRLLVERRCRVCGERVEVKSHTGEIPKVHKRCSDTEKKRRYREKMRNK